MSNAGFTLKSPTGNALSNEQEQSSKSSAGKAGKRSVLWGVASRRERWGLTLRGWLVVVMTTNAVFAVVSQRIHPFLAIIDPIPAEYLVVEGWMPEYAVEQCVEIFITHRYGSILTVGGPVSAATSPAPDDDTHAYVAGSRLRKRGLGQEVVQVIPSTTRDRDRTYGSAVAAREWLKRQGIAPKSITVVTLGVHARRSRLLFEKAFGSKTVVGIVAIENREYDPIYWWRYSEGVKEVVSEGMAYLYVRMHLYGALGGL